MLSSLIEKWTILQSISFCRIEIAYDLTEVPLIAYDGTEMKGFVHLNKRAPKGESTPSKRYLNLLIKGAKQAGLKESYIKQLEATPYYTPPDWIIKARETHIPKDFSNLKVIFIFFDIEYDKIDANSSLTV